MVQTAETSPASGPIPPTSNSVRGRRPAWLWPVALVLVVAASAAGLYAYYYYTTFAVTDDAFIDGHVIDISARVNGYVQRVLVDDNQMVAQNAVLVELDPRDFEAQLAQVRANLAASEGSLGAAKANVDLVKVSAPAALELATASLKSSKLAVDTAQSQVDSAQALLEQKKAALASARALDAQAQADADASQALQVQAQQDWDRYRTLWESETGKFAITKQDVDHAQAAYKSTLAQLESAKKKNLSTDALVNLAEADVKTTQDGVEVAQRQLAEDQSHVLEAEARVAQANIVSQQVGVAESQAAVAAANVELLRAQVRQAELNLSYTKIRASEAGHVSRRTVEPGQQVQPGQALLALVQPNVWVTANYKETQLTNMRAGQPVEVAVDTFPNRTFKAHVDSIQAGTGARFSLLPPENATGYFVKVVQRVPVKIVFDEPLEALSQLSPGMSVTPEVRIKQ